MTRKTTMPEPVAEIQEIAGIEIFDLTDYGKECGLTVGQKFITTDQAEDYKDACVRGALEEAARLCDTLDNKGNCDEYRGAARHSALRIRALIPTTK